MKIEFYEISEYESAAAKLEYWKGEEMRLRVELASRLDEADALDEKSESKLGEKRKIDFSDSKKRFKIRAEIKTNLKIDVAAAAEAAKENLLTLDELEAIERKTSINDSRARKLPRTGELWKYITESPASPSITLTVIDRRAFNAQTDNIEDDDDDDFDRSVFGNEKS